jgi:hypothetical protein
MRNNPYHFWALLLSAAGALFSGYLSAVKLFTTGCAFNEPCPYFIGYPACYFGFAMFLGLFLVSLTAYIRHSDSLWPAKANTAVAALGTLFAGYYTTTEIISWFRDGFATYGLGLSTCTYGFVFFVAVLMLSVRALRHA